MGPASLMHCAYFTSVQYFRLNALWGDWRFKTGYAAGVEPAARMESGYTLMPRSNPEPGTRYSLVAGANPGMEASEFAKPFRVYAPLNAADQPPHSPNRLTLNRYSCTSIDDYILPPIW